MPYEWPRGASAWICNVANEGNVAKLIAKARRARWPNAIRWPQVLEPEQLASHHAGRSGDSYDGHDPPGVERNDAMCFPHYVHR